jgi:hypothetical protein
MSVAGNGELTVESKPGVVGDGLAGMVAKSGSVVLVVGRLFGSDSVGDPSVPHEARKITKSSENANRFICMVIYST